MRRRPGTGAIEARKQRDGSIRFMPRLPDAERTPLGTFATKEEAARILDAAVYELEKGNLTTSKTLEAYGKTVFDRRELDGYRSTKTERERWKYVTGNAELEREPWTCASWPVEAIKRKDVLEWTRELKRLGLSRSTRMNALSTLRTVFNAALDDELIEINPAASVRLKDHGVSEETMRPLSLDQLASLFWAADDEGRHLIAIAVGTGIRQGELRSLRHVDVFVKDEERPHLRICHGAPGKPPKNGKVRRVPVFGLALAAIESWVPPKNDRGLFFSTSPQSSRKESLGCVRRKGEILPRKRWAKWLELAGVDRRVRWHDLRHTSATLLLQGAFGRPWSLEELCDFLGHSSITVTERYAKHLNTLAEGAARRSHTEATRHTADPLSAEEQSRLRDLNSRPTVYESNLIPLKDPTVANLRGFVVALLRRAANHGDVPLRVVQLAGALLDELDASESKAG